MTKYPKSHWPPPDPPEFVRDEWLTTFEAFNLVGRDRFPDEWVDGKELAALSDEEIAANRAADAKRKFQESERKRRREKAKRASVGVRSGSPAPRIRTAWPRPPAPGYQGPPFPLDIMADESVRKETRARGDKVWREIRQWLHADTVLAAYLDDQGFLHDMAENTWARPIAMPILLTGKGFVDGILRPVLISKPHLEAAIRGEPRPDQAAAQDDNALGDEAIEPISAPPAKASEQATAVGSGDGSNSKPKKPGRPSRQAEIFAAYETMRDEGEIDYTGSMKANYSAIRKRVADSTHTVGDAGLEDDTIRTTIRAPFKADKAKAKKPGNPTEK